MPCKSIFIIAVFILLSSCGGNYAITTKKNPECKTIVSGKMHYIPPKQKPKNDLIILSLGRKPIYHFGTIVKKTDNGFIFDPVETYRSDLPEKEYEFDEIVCLMNKDGDILHGKLPRQFADDGLEDKRGWKIYWYLKPVDDPEAEEIIVRMYQGREFSYCLAPGKYKVNKLEFYKNGRDFCDYCEEPPNFIINVEDGVDNYIGDIYFDSPGAEGNKIEIQCEAGSRPSDAAAYSLGGAIGGIANALSKSDDNPVHIISVQDKSPAADKRKKSLVEVK